MPCSIMFLVHRNVELRITYKRNITVSLVLLASARYSEEEDNVPRDSNFCPHFQVHRTNARVKGGTHEVIIEEISRHTHRSPCEHSVKVGDKRDTKAVNHGHSHQVSEI